MENNVTTPVQKGLIISLILMVLSLGGQFAGLSQNKAFGAISFVLFIGGVIWSCISYAKQMDGNVSFGNTFAHGFKVTAVITVLMLAFTFLMIKFIAPEIKEEALNKAMSDMQEKNLSDDQVEQALKLTREYFMVFTIGALMFFYLIVGVIGSLIGAAVAKKNPKSPFENQGQ